MSLRLPADPNKTLHFLCICLGSHIRNPHLGPGVICCSSGYHPPQQPEWNENFLNISLA